MSNTINYPTGEDRFVGKEFTINGSTKVWDGDKWVSKSHGNHEKRIQGIENFIELKIFQSPTSGGLTEINTKVSVKGIVYEVRKTSDDSLATIYSDVAGATEIVQNGTDNKSGGDGVVEFYIADGDYYVEVGGVKSAFSGIVKAINVDIDGGGNAQEFIDETTSDLALLNVSASQTDTRNAVDSVIPPPLGSVLYRYRSGENESLFVYVQHKGNWFQQWQLTRGVSGFDNAVPTHPNGNMWVVNEVSSVIVGPTDSVLGKDMTITGSAAIFGDTVTITDGSVEYTLTGSDFVLTYVARNSNGIADIYIDGVFHSQIDMYDPSTGGVETSVTIASGLEDAPHLIKLSTTGTSNPDAIDTKLRIQEFQLVGGVDFNDLSGVSQITKPMANGSSTFKVGSAALELAVESTVDGNTVFSGAYHKYCYPTTAGSDAFYGDGDEIDLLGMVEGDYYAASNLQLTQDLTLSNDATPIANVSMAHTFNSNGLNLKSKLTWTESVPITRFYQSMWAVEGESVLFGGQSKKLNATGSGSSISLGVFNTYNAAVWNGTNMWASYVSANMPANSQQKEGDYIGMYMWDRSTNSKVYMRGPNGQTVVGESFNTDTSFRIGLVPDTNKVLDYDSIN